MLRLRLRCEGWQVGLLRCTHSKPIYAGFPADSAGLCDKDVSHFPCNVLCALVPMTVWVRSLLVWHSVGSTIIFFYLCVTAGAPPQTAEPRPQTHPVPQRHG